MKIGIASDHRGFKLKEELKKKLTEYEFLDYGTDSIESVDYPDYAFKLGEAVAAKDVDYGVAICGSGIGISIACNKVKKVRCAKISNVDECRYTRLDNDANIVAFSAKTSIEDGVKYIKTFVETAFSNEERHIRRIEKINNYEVNNEC